MSLRILCLSAAFVTAIAPVAAARSVALMPWAFAAHSSNSLALDLLPHVAGKTDNIFYSPVSISAALGMAWGGASGTTASQMAKVLHFDLPEARQHNAVARLLDALGPKVKGGAVMSTANRVWAAQGLRVNASFAKLMNDAYGAGLGAVDFRGDGRQVINAWVADQTHQKIKELLHETDINAATKLVLTNAVYFKGAWKHGFDPKSTSPGSFRNTTRTIVKVPFMHQTANLPYVVGDGWRAVELPYKGGEMSMTVMLPESGWDLSQLEAKLTPQVIASLHARMRTQTIDLALPKFKLSTRYQLKDSLTKLGMVDAFRITARFDRISPDAKLFISKVIHQAVLEVDEQGTVAAAATAVVARDLSARVNQAFTADQPFLVLIRHKATGAIVFMGRVMNPKS